jgi:hypothetical protein
MPLWANYAYALVPIAVFALLVGRARREALAGA